MGTSCMHGGKMATKIDIPKIIESSDYKICSYKDMEQEFFNWRKALKLSERIAICLYRCKSDLFNKALRNNSLNMFRRWMNQNIYNAIKKSEISNNIIVYRNIAKDENKFLCSKQKGSSFIYNNYKGTHVGSKIKIGGCPAHCIFLLSKGTKGAYIGNIGPFKKEREFLLIKETPCHLLDIKIIENKTIYIIEV